MNDVALVLRDYQQETHDALRYNYERGLNRQLAVMFTGAGKGLLSDTPIPTPFGFVPIGELTIGDLVFGSSGIAVRVTGKYEQPFQETYRVCFADDTSIVTDGAHLWQVEANDDPKHQIRVASTDELRHKLTRNNGRLIWKIPTVKPVQYPEADLPLDPYLLGLWLGDGSMRPGGSVMISTPDTEIIAAFSEHYIVTHAGKYDWRIKSDKIGRRSILIDILRQLGLYGKLSVEKHIPPEYLVASVSQRISLLRGLMDTDGYISARGTTIQFNTSSPKLAVDVAELVRSLGGHTGIHSKKTTHHDAYSINAFIPGINPFTIHRKSVRWHDKVWSKKKTISAIIPEGKARTVCISVDAPDDLYVVGREYIVTHNTSGVAAMLPKTFPTLAEHGLLFLSHRREILYQSYQTFRRAYGVEKWMGLEMGEYHATGMEDFVFASVDSIGRLLGSRINKFGHRYFGIIVVDEGHHVSQEGTWDNILNFFGVGSDKSEHHTFKDGTKPLSVFLSATPNRADGQALLPFLDTIAVNFDIKYGMENGWLTDIKSWHAELANDDYSAFDPAQQIDFLIKTWLKYGRGMRTLAFARNVAQSEMLAATLSRQEGVRAGHVDATTPDEIRRTLVDSFGRPYGDPEVCDFLSNRLIFTEGYDNPLIQCVLDNAPASTQSLYIQKIGRGLRPSSDVDLAACKTADERREAIRRSAKPYLTYITTFPLNHGLDMAATLFGLPKSVNTHGKLVSEVIDVIQYEEETMPEAPVRDLSGMSGLDVRLKRQDVWTQTVYNDELKAMTPLRWTMGERFAAIRCFRNPFSTKPNDQTAVIIAWTKDGDAWRRHTIIEGGWLVALNRARKPALHTTGDTESDLHEAIRRTDQMLAKSYPDVYSDLQRSHSGHATAQLIAYLKRKKVAANFDALTQETAMILKDDALIRPKLIHFALPAD